MLEDALNTLKIDEQGTLPIDPAISGLSISQEMRDSQPEGDLGMIKICEDGTFATEICLPNEKKLYVGMEKFDAKWGIYKSTSGRLSEYLSDTAKTLSCAGRDLIEMICNTASTEEIDAIIKKNKERFLNHPIFQKDSGFSDEDFKQGFQENIGLEAEELDNFVNMFKNSLKQNPSIESTLRKTIAATTFFSSDYITYASDKPITEKLKVKSDPLPSETFKLLAQDFGSVIISVGTAKYPDLPVYENRAIFKNPYWVIKGGYEKLSMVLHSFSGKIAQEFWKDKIYMTVAPLPSMQQIILKSCTKGDLFIGDNKNKPYPDFLPLAHELKKDKSPSVFSIAKEGVDTSKYPDSELPDELIQFTQAIDYTNPSPRLKPQIEACEYINYIKIDALARIFLRSYCGKNMP